MLANTRVRYLASGHVQAVRSGEHAWYARQGRFKEERRGGSAAGRGRLKKSNLGHPVRPLRLFVGSVEQWEARRRENQARGNRRAKAYVMRLAMANGLTRMVTLTFGEGVHDRGRALAAYATFRRVACARGVKMLGVLRLHPKGHGYHGHALVSRYISKNELEAWWPHGWVDVRRLPMRVGARYLVGYMTKEKEGDEQLVERVPGDHRYYRSHGLETWVAEDHWCGSVDDFVRLVWRLMEECSVHMAGIEDIWIRKDQVQVGWLSPPEEKT